MISCGIDIEEGARFDRYFTDDDIFVKLVEDVFTEREILNNSHLAFKYPFTAGFTCKEAIFKSLGVSWLNSDIHWKNIELIFTGNTIRDYEIILSGYADNLMKEKSFTEIHSEIIELDEQLMFKVILL